MPAFSAAQNAKVPMKTRLKMKLAKIRQSVERDKLRVTRRLEDGCEAVRERSTSTTTVCQVSL